VNILAQLSALVLYPHKQIGALTSSSAVELYNTVRRSNVVVVVVPLLLLSPTYVQRCRDGESESRVQESGRSTNKRQ
jgi:hypothetical protein